MEPWLTTTPVPFALSNREAQQNTERAMVSSSSSAYHADLRCQARQATVPRLRIVLPIPLYF